MSDIRARLDKTGDVVCDETLRTVRVLKVSQLCKPDTLERFEPSEVPTVEFKLLQRVTVHPKVVLDVSV